MLNLSELRSKTQSELQTDLKKLKLDLAKKKEALMLGKDKKTSVLGHVKKDIARVETVLREKQILEEVTK